MKVSREIPIVKCRIRCTRRIVAVVVVVVVVVVGLRHDRVTWIFLIFF